MSVGFVTPDPLNNLTNLFQRPIFIQAQRIPDLVNFTDVYPPQTTWGDGATPVQSLYVTPGRGIWYLYAPASGGSLNTINGVANVAGNINLIDYLSAPGNGAIQITPVGGGQVGVGVKVDGTSIVITGGDVLAAGPGLINPIQQINVQTGTSPVVPTGTPGTITINGASVAAGVNPVRSDGTGANTLAIEVQRSQAFATSDATRVGLASFDSNSFAVDGNGWVQLTDTQYATITTSDGLGQTRALFTIPAGATPGVYTLDLDIAGFDVGGAFPGEAVGYTLVGAVRTNGVATTLIPGQALDEFEDAALAGANSVIAVAGNNILINVSGVAGETINWRGKVNLVFVS